jgi:hypothetical protein
MPIILNPKLYEEVKKVVYKQYPKHSAYRSGQLVKQYKEEGGKYGGEKPEGGLTSWFKEEWKDVGGKEYPVYRPTKRINKDTPLTAYEIDPENLQDQINLKQKIRGEANLPPFIKGDGLSDFSDIKEVQRLANKYNVGKVFPSTRKTKKYMVEDPDGKMIHFGAMGMEDFTKHNDEERRQSFLRRNKKWKNAPKYSPAFLAYHLLW